MYRMPDILVEPVEKRALEQGQRLYSCPVFWTLNREGPENLALVIQLPGMYIVQEQVKHETRSRLYNPTTRETSIHGLKDSGLKPVPL